MERYDSPSSINRDPEPENGEEYPNG
jgi:hypothetical protein